MRLRLCARARQLLHIDARHQRPWGGVCVSVRARAHACVTRMRVCACVRVCVHFARQLLHIDPRHQRPQRRQPRRHVGDILLQQQARIKAVLDDPDAMQLNLQLGDKPTKDDERQFRSERNYMRARLQKLPAELESEPLRVRGYYDVVSVQVQPVGLAYLWPKTN